MRGFWGGCDSKFHLFHQVLGWSSCLRSPTNRHALVLPGGFVSPDFRLFNFGFRIYYYVDCVEYPYQCILRLWYLETPMTILQRTGTAPLIDCIRQVLRLWPYSTSALICLFALLLNLMNAFAIKVRKVRLFTHFADWRAPPATFVGRKQRTAKKNEPNDCSAPKFLMHRRWLDSGMVFSSLTHSIAEANLFSNLFALHVFFGTVENVTFGFFSRLWICPFRVGSTDCLEHVP